MMEKLFKNKTNKMIFGVCSGLSDYLEIDVSFVRIAFVLGAIFSGSILFWVYLFLGLLLPSKDN